MHAASLLVYTALCAAIDVEPRHPRKRAKVKEAAGLYVTASNSAFGTRGSEASLVPGYICMYLQPRISCKRFWSDLRRTDLATRPIAADRCVALSVWKLAFYAANFTCWDLTSRTTCSNFIFYFIDRRIRVEIRPGIIWTKTYYKLNSVSFSIVIWRNKYW